MSISGLRNYNISFELFLTAVEDYKHFLNGLEGNTFAKYFSDPEKAKDNGIAQIAEVFEPQRVIDDVIARVLDRTVGGLSLGSISQELSKLPSDGNNRKNIIISVSNNDDSNISNVRADQTSMPPSSATGTIKMIDVVHTDITAGGESFDNNFLSKNVDSKTINRFGDPTISAHVIRQSKYGPSGRSVRHLPIFLNAIPDIEMSRCVPYLDIKFVHPRKKSASGEETKAQKIGRAHV